MNIHDFHETSMNSYKMHGSGMFWKYKMESAQDFWAWSLWFDMSHCDTTHERKTCKEPSLQNCSNWQARCKADANVFGILSVTSLLEASSSASVCKRLTSSLFSSSSMRDRFTSCKGSSSALGSSSRSGSAAASCPRPRNTWAQRSLSDLRWKLCTKRWNINWK